MKRVLCFFLCAVLLLLLVACQQPGEQKLAVDDQIKQAFLEREWKEGDITQLTVRYVYTFDDACAVFVDCSEFGYTDDLSVIQVGDYLFRFSNGQNMYIYKNGTLATLREAYGLLTEEQWENLYITWKESNPHLYTDE